MKKGLSLLLCLAIIFSSTTICFGASNSIKQPKISYGDVLDEYSYADNSIGLYWKWDKKVTGYDIYAEYEGRGFEKIDSIKKSKNLTIVTSRSEEKKFTYVYDADYITGKYTFKIKAYKIINGKKHYSKYSNKKVVNMQSELPNYQVTPYYINGYIYMMFDNWYHTYDVEVDLTSIILYNKYDGRVECGALPAGYMRGGSTELLPFPNYRSFSVKNDKLYTAVFSPNSKVLGTDVDSGIYGVYYKFIYNNKEYVGYADSTQSICSPLKFINSY